VEIGQELALESTSAVPIVTLAIDYDPIALGYVRSLAQPPAT